MKTFSITSRNYTFQDFKDLLSHPVKIKIERPIRAKIEEGHNNLNSILNSELNVYGVNTGFGNLSQVKINEGDQAKLQLNLVRSHAAGVGDPLSSGIVRVAMVLKLLTFAKGVSGVRIEVAEKLVDLLNHDIIPIVPSVGSVGASGDLSPLAHIALTLIGEGEVLFNGRKLPSLVALKEVDMEPLILGPKEGLSLINGTQISTALAIQALCKSSAILLNADIIGALTVEASLSSRTVFKSKIHALKKHPGQIACAGNLWKLLEGSKILESHIDCDRIQDPYSIRCMPHVHGASRDIVSNAVQIINNEINSVSDNPLIFGTDEVYSSGHFHAESVSQALDTLAIAISEIGSISERRIHFMMKGIPDKIPPFVAVDAGLESGFMLAHVTAASLVSENKTLSHPASVDSIPTSGGQEDFVSMAPWSGRKVLQIIGNVNHILSIELLVSFSALVRFFKDLSVSPILQPVVDLTQQRIKIPENDFIISPLIHETFELLEHENLIKVVQKNVTLE